MQDKGFTLIEMLVAMAIFASLMSVLLFGYSQGLSLWQRSMKQSDVWEKYQFRFSLFRNLSRQMIVADYRVGRVTKPFFDGDDTGFRAMTAAPILSPSGRPVPVEFRLHRNESGEGVQLLYREGNPSQDPGRGMAGFEREKWVVLVDQMDHASFRYYADKRADSWLLDGRTVRRWFDKVDWGIPLRIEFVFKDDHPEEHHWRVNSQAVSNAVPLVVIFGGA